MSTIRVGRGAKKAFTPGEVTAKTDAPASETMTEEQKANFMESVSRLPEEKREAVMRSVGFEEEKVADAPAVEEPQPTKKAPKRRGRKSKQEDRA